MTDLPAEAVEAAARRLCAITSDDESGWYCETHGTEIYVAGLYYCATGEDDARAALTAAAPHIAKQATSDLLAGIEALRDEWQAKEREKDRSDVLCARDQAAIYEIGADALDALLERAR